MGKPPAIAYLKTSDALALKREFKGWAPRERDAKLSDLLDAISATNILYGGAAVLVNADFKRVALGYPNTAIGDTFLLLFTQGSWGLILVHRDIGPEEPVQFIF